MENNNPIFVPQPKFNEMWDKVETRNISENHQTRFSTHYLGREYVLTWSQSSRKEGRIFLGGYAVEDVATYRGTLAPMAHEKHFQLVNAGERERSYTGMIVKFEKRNLVFCEQVTFKQIKTKNLTLFEVQD
jgi:hypothetical protein